MNGIELKNERRKYLYKRLKDKGFNWETAKKLSEMNIDKINIFLEKYNLTKIRLPKELKYKCLRK